MLSTTRLLQIPYQEGGRTLAGADCWGMVYLVKKHNFGIELPLYGGARKSDMTRAFTAECENYKYGFAHGAIACVFEKSLMVHVGVVLKNEILHTSIHKGCRLDRRQKFEKLGRVEYYL